MFISKLDFEMKADEANVLPRRGSDAHTQMLNSFLISFKTQNHSHSNTCAVWAMEVFSEPLMKIR